MPALKSSSGKVQETITARMVSQDEEDRSEVLAAAEVEEARRLRAETEAARRALQEVEAARRTAEEGAREAEEAGRRAAEALGRVQQEVDEVWPGATMHNS